MKTSSLLFVISSICIGLTAFKPKAVVKALPKSVQKEFVFIPSSDATQSGFGKEISAFMMSKTEISNGQYRAFLTDLKSKGEMDKYALAVYDSTVWNVSYCEPYMNYYSWHPAYRNYPVVGVSKAGAELYCQWLTDKINTQLAGKSKVKVMIPTSEQWLYAANSGTKGTVYSWRGNKLQNLKGQHLCNYRNLGAENIHWNEVNNQFEIARTSSLGVVSGTSDNADITAPVTSYFENTYGLFNMNGNVAELVSDVDKAMGGSWNSAGYDVRNESFVSFQQPSSTVGFRPVIIWQE
jgi:formylglycine-generating enzyme required for sulfatase activity